MRKIRTVVFALMLMAGFARADEALMTQDEMEKIVLAEVEVLAKKEGYLVFEYKKVRMALISDTKYDHMRIIAPIINYSDLTSEQKDQVMEANFDKALDARYAVSEGVLYSVFIHPLSLLSQSQLKDALNQVPTLASSFGRSYSSGTISFGGE